MKIRLMSIYVDDQEKALRFYTDILGFQKKMDFSRENFRWLTLVSPEEPDGVELQLDLNNNQVARTYQEGLSQQGARAAMFFVSDLEREYERLSGLGVTFTTPPTKTPGSTIAVLDDTCGNLIQLTQLAY